MRVYRECPCSPSILGAGCLVSQAFRELFVFWQMNRGGVAEVLELLVVLSLRVLFASFEACSTSASGLLGLITGSSTRVLFIIVSPNGGYLNLAPWLTSRSV